MTGNINLKEYNESNLRLLAFEHAGKLTPPERNSDGSILSGVAMAAALYDSATQRYFIGKSGKGHTNADGAVPASIWNTICAQTVNVKDDAFGTNCAEVDCLVKAFRAREKSTATSLGEMTFVAFKVGERKCRGPRRTCKAWIATHGARALMPQ